jgi:hypothetical protein
MVDRRDRAQPRRITVVRQHLGSERRALSDGAGALVRRTGLGPAAAATRKAAGARELRRSFHVEGRARARQADAGYAIGCMLHWAEGDKCRNSVRLSNSDPELVATFLGFLRRHFAVRDEEIAVYCNLFADHAERQGEIEEFWLAKLRLPRASLRKSSVNVYSKHSQKKRRNKLPYGTCKVCVNSTRIQHIIYGSIQEYGGFERPEWLD